MTESREKHKKQKGAVVAHGHVSEQAKYCLEQLGMPTDDAMVEAVVGVCVAHGSLNFYAAADSIRLVLEAYGKPTVSALPHLVDAEAVLRESAKKRNEWWRGNRRGREN